MPCTSPLVGKMMPSGQRAWRRKTDDWKDGLVVPCGQCVDCRLRNSRDWAVRCMHEVESSRTRHGHSRAAFLTLTYDDAHLGDNQVSKKDWQAFAKALRKRIGPFRFLMCAEYGDETHRRHMHACIFGHAFEHDRFEHCTTKTGHKLFRSPTLEAAWTRGYSNIGDVSFNSARYVASYVLKKQRGLKKIVDQDEMNLVDTTTGEVIEREPEFALMSRSNGLGHDWLKANLYDVYPRDHVIMEGKKYKPPLYYDRLLKKWDPDLHDQVLAERREHVEQAERCKVANLKVRARRQEAFAKEQARNAV